MRETPPINERLRNTTLMRAARRIIALAVLASCTGASSKAADTEQLGSNLLTAVLANDVAAVSTIFQTVSGAQAVRLANAIDWRGKSVLMHAANKNHHEIVQVLVDNKARVDAADYTGGATAMMLAARNGSLEAVEVLIAAGASMGVATPTGTTTLMQAVANGSLPVVAAILRAGAELDARDKTGATAVSISATMGFTDVARLLANAGAALDIADQQGSSPLLVAAAGGHLDTVRARPRARNPSRDMFSYTAR